MWFLPTVLFTVETLAFCYASGTVSMNITPMENTLLSQDEWLGSNCLCLKLALIPRN